MLALDLCQVNYQTLLIIYLKYIAKTEKDVKKKKKSNQYVTLQDLKIINDIIYATTVKKRRLKPINRLTKKYPNKYEFCNGDINKFNLLLRNGVYPYEYMDS